MVELDIHSVTIGQIVQYQLLVFNIGYLSMPNDVYFSGDYTLSVWVKVRSFQFNSRIIDVGNGPNLDNVIFALTYQSTAFPFSQISKRFFIKFTLWIR